MQEFINYVRLGVDILAVLGITFEVIPIKFSPLRWIGEKLSKSTNDRIDKIQKQVDNIEYENDMRDLRNTKSRIHFYGLAAQEGRQLSEESLKSVLDDLDVYDFYKEKYKYLNINGKRIKINGEVEIDREIITEMYKKMKTGSNK